MRTYHQLCPLALALDRIGDRWTLLILRELLPGPLRFSDLRDGLNGIASNLLTQRLRDLEGHGLVVQRQLPPPANVKVYELTQSGRDLKPAVVALARWGLRFVAESEYKDSVPPPRTMAFGLTTLLPESVPPDLVLDMAIRNQTTEVTLRAANGQLEVLPLPNPDARARVDINPEQLAGLMSGTLDPSSIKFDGDPSQVMGLARVAMSVMNPQ